MKPAACSFSLTAALTLALLGGCRSSEAPAPKPGSSAAQQAASGHPAASPVQIDGSSTVAPITEAVAEEFQKANPGQRVTMGVSGTGGGFKKLCNGELAIAGASRPIKAAEVEACARAGIEYIELPVAYDGLTVVVNAANDWAKDGLTVAELKKLWAPEAQGKATLWRELRAGWPAEPVHLFGAGVDSGTYDYFTQAIVGKEHSSRGDYTSSEDDNVLVKGVASDRLALGFFGYAYFEQNQDKLKAVPIDDGDASNGAGFIGPTPTTIADATYQPLSRPVFVYVTVKAAGRPEVESFLNFYLTRGPDLAKEVGYVPLPADLYAAVRDRFAQRRAGSLFGGEGSKVGMPLAAMMAAQGAPPVAAPAASVPASAPASVPASLP